MKFHKSDEDMLISRAEDYRPRASTPRRVARSFRVGNTDFQVEKKTKESDDKGQGVWVHYAESMPPTAD